MILLKFFGPSLQFPCESNFPLHRVMVWDSDCAQNFTERNIVQNNDLKKTENLSACVMEAFIL